MGVGNEGDCCFDVRMLVGLNAREIKVGRSEQMVCYVDFRVRLLRLRIFRRLRVS